MNEKAETRHTILIVDDHPVFREGLRRLLEKEKDLKVVGEAGDGLEAIERLRELSPDLLVMDIAMPNLDGIDATRQILSKSPDTRVVALSVHSGKSFVRDMLQAGAVGYILKESVPEEMVQGISYRSFGRRVSEFRDLEYRPLRVQKISVHGPTGGRHLSGADSSHQAAHSPRVRGYRPQAPADRTSGKGSSKAHGTDLRPCRVRKKRPCEPMAGGLHMSRRLVIS